jgi:hypothetical protein
VIRPINGAVGVTGCAGTTTFAEGAEGQPEEFETVYV